MATLLKRELLTVDQFERMIADGVFAEDERLELIRGEIIEMSPIENPHATCVRRLINRLVSRLGTRALIDAQDPIRLERQQSRPQPDIVVLRPAEDFYSGATPEPKDILLVIEVADSSLAYDRKVKIPLYAEAGISEAWLMDLNSGRIFTYRQPSPDGYRQVREHHRGEWISPEAFPDERFQVDDFLG